MNKLITSVLTCIVLSETLVAGYKIFDMEESGSCLDHSVEINVGSLFRNSSGILINARESLFKPGLNCTVFLRPPLSHGIVVSIRNIDLKPSAENSEDCENYVEISPVLHHGSVRLCGYSNDEFEFQSYTNWGGIQVSFHTSNSTHQQKASFELTFTAIRKGGGWCFKDEKRCRNHFCIWKDLTCDGHNNCGDLSDEIDKHISQCAALTPGESLAVILVTIVGSLILLFIAAYLRGPKITRQIERLSQGRRTNFDPGSTNTADTDANDIRAVPTISRIRTNYGSTSQFMSSYDYNDDVVFHDPPPRYEDVTASSQVSLTVPPAAMTVPQVSITATRSPETFPQVSTPQNSANRYNREGSDR